MAIRGRFVVGKGGAIVPALRPPEELEPVRSSAICGPTRLGEWLMVDVRLAKLVSPQSRAYEVCQNLSTRGACGVVESTLIIDLLEATAEDRLVLLNSESWPKP